MEQNEIADLLGGLGGKPTTPAGDPAPAAEPYRYTTNSKPRYTSSKRGQVHHQQQESQMIQSQRTRLLEKCVKLSDKKTLKLKVQKTL